jgi:uncharacterized membrane protein
MVKLPSYVNDLGVKGRVAITDSLAVELVVFSISARLWSFISKNGSKGIQLHWLW